MAAQSGGGLLRSSWVLPLSSSLAQRSFSSQAVEAEERGPVCEGCRTALPFKQASETAVLPLQDTHADVIWSSAVHGGQWETEPGGPVGPDKQEPSKVPSTAQRDQGPGGLAVGLGQPHQHAQADGVLRGGRRGQRGQRQLLAAVVSQAAWTHRGSALIDQLTAGRLRRTRRTNISQEQRRTFSETPQELHHRWTRQLWELSMDRGRRVLGPGPDLLPQKQALEPGLMDTAAAEKVLGPVGRAASAVLWN